MPDLTFSKVTTWQNAQDPNNIPVGFKIIMAEDILRWENFCDAAKTEVNSLRGRVGTAETTVDGLVTWKNTADTDITNLKKLRAISTKTGNYPVVQTDSVIIGNATGLTITLPSAVTSTAGKQFTIKNRFAGNLTVASTAGTIDGAATKVLAQWASATFISDGANWYVI